MTSLSQLTQTVRCVQHGFKEMRIEAEKILQTKPTAESLNIAERLLGSDYAQVRMVAVFVLGGLAARSGRALKVLRARVAGDPDWRVQETHRVAQTFDHYCHAALVRAELNTWDTNNERVAQTHQLAARFLT